METTNGTTASPLLIAATWLLVLVPTGWGLTYTVHSAMKLFTTQPASGQRHRTLSEVISLGAMFASSIPAMPSDYVA